MQPDGQGGSQQTIPLRSDAVDDLNGVRPGPWVSFFSSARSSSRSASTPSRRVGSAGRRVFRLPGDVGEGLQAREFFEELIQKGKFIRRGVTHGPLPTGSGETEFKERGGLAVTQRVTRGLVRAM